MKIKKMKTILSVFLVSLFFITQLIAIEISEYKLANGLTVILNEDHSVPKVFGVVVCKTGGKNDPVDATGMAHYQEHMLFKGTEELGTVNWEKEKPHIDKIFELYDKLGQTTNDSLRKEIQKLINEESLEANKYAIPNELSNIINSMGGSNINAGTGPDMTIFYNSFPATQIEKWLELYSHRFINPVFRGFQSELEVVYEEKNMYTDMFQFSLIQEFQRYFFKNHPYGQQTLIGSIDDLKNPSLTKMYEFFKTYYVANNMALILSGDFQIEDIKPMIKEKFGKWKSGEIPAPIVYEEKPFPRRELVEKRVTPIKMGLLGFRTVPNGHPDEIPLEVCNSLLANQNQTGYLDKLGLDNKLLAAAMIPLPYNDHGCSILFIVPKLLGQSLEKAEKLVLTELDKVKTGEFEDWMLESIKLEKYRNHQLAMESIQNKAVQIANAFGQNRDIHEYLKYPEKIQEVTREDVIRVANKYFGDKYLAFFSKMGRLDNEKIEKPGYKPVVSNTKEKSTFAKKLEDIPVQDIDVKYIDFEKDISVSELQNGVNLYYTKNPLNDVFSIKLKFGIGDLKLDLLEYASQIINYSGTENYNLSELKNEFSKIGCTYNIYSDNSYIYINAKGIEKNLDACLKLINEIMTIPKLEPEKINLIVEGEKSNRKMERSEPANVADALFEWVKYKEKSRYLNRLSIYAIKKLDTEKLVHKFQEALTYESQIHYVGKKEIADVVESIKSNITFAKQPKPTDSPVIRDVEKYNENIVYFVNKKKAVQSKVYLFSNGSPFRIQKEPQIHAFNLYFGGGFSGLVLQEIREYRSLAYSAGSRYSVPIKADINSNFTGYVGTQADKTLEAMQVFNDLIRNMPQKEDRMDMIKSKLSLSLMANRPHFRDLSNTILSWKLKGYKEDPGKLKIPAYQNMEFNDIVKFYNNNIKNNSLVFAIVGNEEQINTNEFSKYGKVNFIEEDDLFSKKPSFFDKLLGNY